MNTTILYSADGDMLELDEYVGYLRALATQCDRNSMPTLAKIIRGDAAHLADRRAFGYVAQR